MATSDVPLTIVAGTLPSGAVYNPQTYFNAIVARMTATVDDGNILWGQLGGTEPTGVLPGPNPPGGLWFGSPVPADNDNGYWNMWNTDAAKYLPIRNVCGQYINGDLRVTDFVCGAKTDDTTITTPDESGTLALVEDLPLQQGTQTYTNQAVIPIDWLNRAPVYTVMPTTGTPNLTISFNDTHVENGWYMDFWLENKSAGTANAAATFSIPRVYWSGYWDTSIATPAYVPGSDVEPNLSKGVINTRVVDHVRVYRVAGIYFGALVERDYRILNTSISTSPVPTSADGSGTTINVHMSNVLAGGTADPAAFKVRVGGTLNACITAIYSGQTVTVQVTTTLPKSQTVTIQYAHTGTNDLKSIHGDMVADWPPFNVDISGGNGGVHNRGTGPTGIPKAPP
jgi:hypothetical protein